MGYNRTYIGVTVAIVLVVAALVGASTVGNSEPATVALRVLIQSGVVGYGFAEARGHRDNLTVLAAGLVTISGGLYGLYLIRMGEHAFTTLPYLALVGTGMAVLQLTVAEQDISPGLLIVSWLVDRR